MDDKALASIADGLYARPLDEFVAARTAAAKGAAGGDKELGAAVRGLAKPSAAAWAVNMLALHRPDTLAELVELGRRMRAAQASLDAPALRELGRERRALLTAAVDTARSVARQHGRALSDAMAAGVEETLRASTADEGAAAAVRSGRLLSSLSADGVNPVDLDGAVAVPAVLPAVPKSASPAGAPATAPGRQRTTAERTPRAKPVRPRLEAVRQTPRPVSPPALDKAQAALAEAEEEEARTSRLARELGEQVEQTRNHIAALAEDTKSLRDRLKAAEAELELARKRLVTSVAEEKQAARAAEKAGRTAMLARERVLRLGNTRS